MIHHTEGEWKESPWELISKSVTEQRYLLERIMGPFGVGVECQESQRASEVRPANLLSKTAISPTAALHCQELNSCPRLFFFFGSTVTKSSDSTRWEKLPQRLTASLSPSSICRYPLSLPLKQLPSVLLTISKHSLATLAHYCANLRGH